MGAVDWNISTNNSPPDSEVVHAAFQHTNVPTQQLTHDIWCRQVDNPAGTGFGRVGFDYNGPDAGDFTLAKDLSVRGAMSIGLRGADHTVGIGVRLGGGVPGTFLDQPMWANNGYILNIEDNAGPEWHTNLYRVTAGVPTPIWGGPQVAGSLSDYKWFQYRLDFLIQPNGDAILQVYENDLTTNDADAAVWVKISPDIGDLAVNVPAFAGIGWGGQVDAGAGLANEFYIDWLECWRS